MQNNDVEVVQEREGGGRLVEIIKHKELLRADILVGEYGVTQPISEVVVTRVHFLGRHRAFL